MNAKLLIPLAWTLWSLSLPGLGYVALRIMTERTHSPEATRRLGLFVVPLLAISHASVPDYREAIALLLQHGAEADQRDGGNGLPLLHHAGEHPDIVRLLVEHGADVEGLDEYGQSPVVRFTGQQKWEAAQYLVERGARLDVATANGVSRDYYLKDWKDSVFGEHPEGWERLRAAIAKRPASSNSDPPSASPKP